MREVAERRQQLELEHEQALAILKFKQNEIKRLQRSKVRELENKCHSQSEQFSLLSHELETFRLQAGKLDLSGSTILTNPPLCHLTNGVGLTGVSSMNGEGVYLSWETPGPRCFPCRRKQEQRQNTADRVGGSSHLPLIYYNPYDGPNDNPEVELPLTAGEYIYVYGGMDDDGFYEGELMDGRRGLVPSNFVERVSDDDMISAHVPEAPLTNGLDLDLEVGTVPYPRKLTLIKQLAKSIIISWDGPLVPAGWGNVWSYNVYVDQELKLNVPFGSQTKAVLERLDVTLKAYRVSVQSLTERGNSDQLRCSLLVGRDVCVAPTQLRVDRVTATSASLAWLPSNSNYVHVVSLNEEEMELVKAGSYSLCLGNLTPSLQYTVKVEAQPHQTPWEIPQERREHKTATTTFTTLAAGPPDAPLGVQLEQGPSPGIALISWLPVTIDAAGTSNGVRVTGYTIYADKRKVLEVSSPTAGSALMGPSQIQSLMAAHELTVRTMSAHGESIDSVPVNVPAKLSNIMTGQSTPVHQSPPYQSPPIHQSTPIYQSPPIRQSTPIYQSPPYQSPPVHQSTPVHQSPPYQSPPVHQSTPVHQSPPYQSPPVHQSTPVHQSPPYQSPPVHQSTPVHQSPPYQSPPVHQSTPVHQSPSYQSPPVHQSTPVLLFVCLRAESMDHSWPIGDNEVRIFVALFPYDPVNMSPNPDAAEEELPFREGQIIKIYGDKDLDGFYRGESSGRHGYVPCNMVSEIQVEDEETRETLLQQGFLSTATNMEKIGRHSCQS
uniref:SH3 domain-containing protein n=1 Tax=Oncorhynchus mykiss TaxID=8022 RepID=A0A8K9WLB7_ONCMY